MLRVDRICVSGGWWAAAIVLLNSIPVLAVLRGDWLSFDLIFLYWFENLIIGGIVLLRLLIRPYAHALDLIFPLLLAPFFALHFGMFCYVHGSFVISLFGDARAGIDGAPLLAAVQHLLATPTMLAAIVALSALQLFDWLSHAVRRGFATAGVKELMTHPYRRIVVLHLTILASGFVLVWLNDPIVGLLALVVAKTASDIWHFKHDGHGADRAKAVAITPELLAEMRRRFPEPRIEVNGTERRFPSFAALKASREFRLAGAVMRLVGSAQDLQAINTYLDMKIREER